MSGDNVRGNSLHEAVSADGTTIVGRVHGNGPPLVFVHGGGGNGESSWRLLLPQLVDRFTCYAMSTRGRGLSGDHPDHSIGALVGDVVSFVDSIGEQVGVVGHSSSLALAAAAGTDAISAVAVHEPAVPAVASVEDPRPGRAIERMIDAAGDGRYVDAVRAFFEESGLFLDDEVATLAACRVYESMAPNVPAWCQEMPEFGGATDPAVLHRVTAPVMLLRGSRTPGWFRDSVDYVAAQLADVRVREVAGGGHMSPVVVPDVVARELDGFLLPVKAMG